MLRDGLSIPLAALAVAVAITIFAWYSVTVFVNGLEQAHFEDEVLATVFSINNRMQEYEQVLFGAKGLFASSQQVEMPEWKAFVDNQMIRQRFPGMQGVGFIERVPADKLASHIASARGEGFANYTVWPESQKQEYYPVLFLEPLDARNRQVLGFDVSSEQVRNAAISEAMESGQTTITGKITSVMKTQINNTQSGFLMLVPVYENGLPADTPDERRENIKGFVYSSFRMNDLMSGITGRTVSDVTFSIHDGSPESQNLVFDLAAVAGTKEADIDRSFEKTVIMEIGGRQWILEFAALDSIHSG
ncbi:MAG: CHASE domain-containing protein, partial [Nitrososphaera sp.]